MKRHLLPVIASIALAAGIGAASAANDTAMSKHSSMSNPSRSMAKDTLSLTSSQQKLAWNDISKQRANQASPSGFVPSVGTAIPSTISLLPVPAKVSGRVPELGPYDYALLKNELLIVNPTDKKIVEVIHA
ncbi:hypothetical protein ACVW1C_003002 [Bradyrhizobium sp. USDA 4011]